VTAGIAIVNPIAGGGRAARVWRSIGPWFVEHAIVCSATGSPGEAIQLVREAVARGAERVIAVGGDGTVSEIAASLVCSSTALAVIPAGSGNDFARAIGIPRKPAAAAHLALRGSPTRVDAGCATSSDARRTFVNVAGCGFDADVVRHLAYPRGGSLAYLAAVLGTLSHMRPIHLRLTFDGGRTLERSVVGLAVANGTHYGGGLRIAPRALLDDDLFDVCVVGARNPLGVLALLPWLYLGAHARRSGVEFFRAHRVQVDALDGAAVGCQVDGELIGDLPVTFDIQPAALRVIAGRR
jgi:diacylglycerol kinase (ATP)